METIVKLIAPMTSNTSNGIVITASSFLNTRYSPYYAFDGEKLNSFNFWASLNKTFPQWLKVDFKNENTIVKKYRLYAASDSNSLAYYPKQWTFEGSNDGTIWVVLDTRSESTNMTVSTYREYSISNEKSYRYYRINITNHFGASYIGIQEMELYGYVRSCKYLIQDKNNIIYTLNTSGDIVQAASQTLDEGNYRTNGFNELLNVTQINQLKSMGILSDYKLLMYTYDAIVTTAILNYKCESYRPIDRADTKFKVLMYKE